MHHTRLLFFLALLCSGLSMPLSAQTPACGPDGVADTSSFSGTAFFNYGSSARMTSQKYRSASAVGQTFVGYIDGLMFNSTVGFYSRYLLAPFALTVKATQGDLLDRIQLSWEIDALGPSPTEGFNIYRDGIFLATVGPNIRNYNDFNVIPGIPYNYNVRGINVYGEGATSNALGFQVPNGVVTGWVQTINGSPVPDAMVTLTPMQGFSAKFGPMDGAFAVADTSGNPFMPNAGDDWTMTFWIKTDLATINAGLIQLTPFPLYFRALNSAGGHEGVELATSAAGAPFLSGTFADSTKNGWHHVALSFEGGSGDGRLYIDGILSALAPMNVIAAADALNLGSRTGTGGWTGRLDELRMYHHLLDELDFREVMEGTASSLTPYLTHYWKMDEEQGVKSYDIMKRHKLYFCGATFDAQRPPVRTAGKTTANGYYRIESASYGTGTTFLAEPKKEFYFHRALKMVRNEQDYASLPNFSVTPKATFELWVNSAGPAGTQSLVSKKWTGNDFRLLLKQNGLQNEVWFYLDGQEQNFGTLGMGYQHLAFTIDSSGNNRTVNAYKNGIPFGAPHTFTGITGNWSDPAQGWVLGARPSGANYTDYFGGLMDEFAVYDSTLSAAAILGHFQQSRNVQEKGLRVYFALDEGNGIRLNNSGSLLLSPGTDFGADWSPFAANQTNKPHAFTPVTRQVTLNPSVTSVDQVDFVDRSTIAVSGFVRYKNTDCFAKKVEILVNGASFSPKIFTDSTGKFVIDLDPGATATLTPKFEDHVFVPAFWDVTNVSSPIAGILFNDITTRKIKGQVAGGFCKKSIIKAPPGMGQGTFCVVKVRSVDGCLERIMTIDNQEGHFEFTDLPPLDKFTVAVVEHSDPLIKTAFQVLGGSTVDLSKRDTIIDFLYFAPPEVVLLSGLDNFSPSCDLIVLDQGEYREVNIKLKEQYVPNGDDGVCYLDTASFHIINGFSDGVLDTTMSKGLLKYKFRVGVPNPSPPFLKTFQILATSLTGVEGTLIKQGIVTGIRNKANTFTTMLPEIPSLILRDPPGDGSYSYLGKNEKVCKTTVVKSDVEIGGGFGVTIHLGADAWIVNAPLGLGTLTVEDGLFDVGTEVLITNQKITDNSFETCTSFSSKISTNSGQLVVGGERGGDVYVGVATNIIFGFADQVTFNDTTCSAGVKVVLNVEPGNFATSFVYSEFNIQNNVLRYLNLLANDPNTDSTDAARYLKSKSRWEAILARNKMLKDSSSHLIRNISFDAGATFEYSETSDTTTSASLEQLVNSDISVNEVEGFEILGLGAEGSLKFVTKTSHGGSTGSGTEKGITTGYVLSDDDPGDAFTVDVAMDSVYKTPIFKIKAGQSSCPWEPGTANREGPNLQLAPGSQFVASNVPANEPAVFQLQLGNLSASNEDWTYGFSAIGANNPNGAVIKLNGAVLNSTKYYIIPYGTSQTVTLTVERGPVKYDYDSLLVAEFSDCEYQRDLALSLPIAGDPKFFSPIYLGAHFIRPCSEVAINVPEQDWVVFPNPLTPGNDDDLRITVSGYDTTVTDFQLVRVQYRRSDGDGAWINIPGISDRYNPNWSGYANLPDPKPPLLQSGFTQFFWETTGLSDGPYEIRAVAVCSGDATDKPGYSQVIKGRIDREPPSLVGTPQPSDGVYNVGDEISFTFNKNINCDHLIPADLAHPNNVALYDATTGHLIDISVTCFQNKIVINPNFQNEYFENRILRAELHDIEDLTGNKNTFLKWEFYVDRNELAWLTDSLGMTKFEDQTKTAVANIHNRGGYPVPFSIVDVPDWVHVVPTQGTLAPNEIRPITFTVDSSLAFGLWSDSITLHTETGQNPFFMGGNEGLPFGVRVVCRPPNWNLNSNLFENTMNMVVELNIQGILSHDVEDMVVAFIGDTLVGRAHIQFVPQTNKYLAYLTIYGNPNDVLLPLRLEIWDASACLRYAVLETYFKFQPDNVIGNPLAPQVLHTNGYVLRDVPLGLGWNWLSFNLAFPNPGIDSVLISLQHPQNDLMKGQNAFSTYLNGGGWFGSLQTLGNNSMYIYRADQPDTLKMLGNVIDPSTTPISLVSGWNWIGYIPNYSLSVNAALSSISAQTGDIIKSQVSFAQYINPAFGWIGNLKYMAPPNGYQVKLSAPGTLVYPPPTNMNGSGTANRVPEQIKFSTESQRPRDETPPVSNFWTVDPTQFENSMTLIGMLKVNGLDATTATMELGAFAGNEARGSATAIYIEPLQSYQFFLTTYANGSGGQLHFKLFDSSTGAVQDLSELMYFSPDLHQGSIESPVPFTLPTSGTQESIFKQSFDVQPNPFHAETVFRFGLPKAQEVTITVLNTNGKSVSSVRTAAREGLNTMIWKGQTDAGAALAAGIYFVRLQTESGSAVRKVVLE
jgi:hypothetical protein